MSKSVLYTSSPLLASRTPMWRSRFIVAAVAVGFLGLSARAAYVQVFANKFFQHQGEVRFGRTLVLPANRGRILDRNGVIMASSVIAQSIWAIPEDVGRDEAKLTKLAQLLDMPRADLDKKLADEDKTFVWLKRQVDDPVAQQIAALGINGVYLRRDYKRKYPEGESSAHVLGFTGTESTGQAGVELAFDKQLAGKPGARKVIKDRLGHVVEDDVSESAPPVDGPDLQLSIDSKVQFFAYQKIKEAVLEHKARAGSVVVLDSTTGELLALANYPSYDPNNRQELSGPQLRNIALTDVFEPGSTMKPFTIGLALETGRVKPSTQIQTAPGSIQITGSTISDSHPHGVLTVQEVIQKSSNVGTVKMAMQMQPKEMWDTFSQAGFGQRPNVPFPGAAVGRLRPYKTWRPIEQATMSYGYGLSASLFQMARSYTVFAHNGQIIPATLTKHETPAVGTQVFSANTALEIRKMLQMAAGPGGTGPLAQTVGYSVGGKSGTARKQAGKGYASNKYRAWFTGMAPIESPRIIVAVMVDEPSNGKFYGGEVAAPVFSAVVQQTLRTMTVQPDLEVKPQIVVNAVEESFR
jgi:cell division protein FtsI (penicillin-binding protein 3)